MARVRNHEHPIQANHHRVLSGHSPLCIFSSTNFLISGWRSKNSSIYEQKQRKITTIIIIIIIIIITDSDNDNIFTINIDIVSMLSINNVVKCASSPPKCGNEILL